ncbi:hypothetical protein L1987_77484 [Smallanthus sonchifolius]|uniref:Uncharacterized protein n=1 Tax=Smallanthus sonchifolius TaxID=185202 RepID=A0ACB8Z9Q2_9ASTR|nr:hypothetical protein L1987_77484 [Smallanthus sonchifolius]
MGTFVSFSSSSTNVLSVGNTSSSPHTSLKIAPDWRQALTLRKAIEDRVTKDGAIGIGISATAVGLIAGGIAAALMRRH